MRLTLAVVGVGLLGGSIALAARQRRVAGRIVGCDRSEGVLERAAACQMLDMATTDLALAVAEADLVVLCLPVDAIVEGAFRAAAHCRPGALITDVGSTKGGLVRALDGRLPAGVAFVGSHPLAGSEKSGPEHARADLFENRLVVVTPGAKTPPADVARVMTFWHALGASVVPMPAEEHDRALAMTSHLPHVVASALAGVLPPEWQFLTATGFRDTTRVAAGGLEMWRAIFLANREPLLHVLGRFRARLEEYTAALAAGDAEALARLWLEGKQSRDALG
jgi:cyclohexadieny/prephenate dehydrogenase